MKKVWIVGLYLDCEACEERWLIQGVYTSGEKAIEACKNRHYFIGTRNLDEDSKSIKWEDCYYPFVETKDEANKRTENMDISQLEKIVDSMHDVQKTATS